MDKINREELMKVLNLTEEDLEKVAGGGNSCMEACVEAEGDMVMYCITMEPENDHCMQDHGYPQARTDCEAAC